MVKPMREELTDAGFVEMLTAADVDKQMKRAKAGLALVAVNSVTGPAFIARHGVRLALEEAPSRFRRRAG